VHLGRALACALALLLVAASWLQPVVAAAQSDAPDYPITDGQFFTEALPDRDDGAGFAVEDGHGAKLWTAYRAEGGVDTLGYPISGRFELRGATTQAFQNGLLRWNPEHGSAERLDFSQLPGRKPPPEALKPQFPPSASADVDPTPWSGWWWPASESVGPTLFAPNSPLDKYDQYVAAVTGANPNTRAWERQELYFPGTSWAGHCNGFAAAALLEHEPTSPVDVLGITFSVADLKGLLVDYHFGDAAAWSFGENGELNPADFHRMLLKWVASAGKGFVLTYDMGGGEVWSYPVYHFESQWSMDPVAPGTWQVKTTVLMADMNVPPNFVGTKPYPGPAGKTFTYTIQGDPRNPTDGAWTGESSSGRFSHPGRIWYPEASVRNDERDLVSPGLDRRTVANILAGSDGTDVTAMTPTGAGSQP
jgi:Transglutaminase elicitor